ncbi:MAG: tRNA (guanosine(46)-N7)-methyltransferase TrmB [Prevotellaceae bacterium]|nr:tRNA (guanosine(46)-N7)-methyltransferase TrmB [Prevotellaceae bacterium]
MGKGKLEKFAEMEEMENVFQLPFSVVKAVPFDMKGHWREQYFGNSNPIYLELGCGKGEYTVGLARLYPNINFIGVDIKGARMWTGARQALHEGLRNVAFLRTNIEAIEYFFDTDEVDGIWLTFSDPQMKKVNKRLTSTNFLGKYRKFLKDGGEINVKTDSNFLYTYTNAVVELNHLSLDVCCDNIYADNSVLEANPNLNIRTYYEQMWLDRGITIKYIRFRLTREGDLQEPDIDIPEDTYRSYGRNKRTQG